MMITWPLDSLDGPKPERPEMEKSLDNKISRILADPSVDDFILADAKDADMGFGVAAGGANFGEDREQFPFRSLEQYRQSHCARLRVWSLPNTLCYPQY